VSGDRTRPPQANGPTVVLGTTPLRDAYAAQERAVVAIAARLDEVAGGY
jgi:hypothetical protein